MKKRFFVTTLFFSIATLVFLTNAGALNVKAVLRGSTSSAPLATSPTPSLQPLPKLEVDLDRVTVSGVSSGAFMAVQLHVAHSRTFKGAASIAGGIWECAKGDPLQSQMTCMRNPQTIDAKEFIELARARAARGEIDDVQNLNGSRVAIFASPHDSVVNSVASDKLSEFYLAFLPTSAIGRLSNPNAAHGMPTIAFGNPCSTAGKPWILNCNDDVAGKLLAQIERGHAALNPPSAQDPTAVVYFDQIQHVGAAANMFPWGAAYIPKSCTQPGTRCGIHVALHGCQMNPDDIQSDFILHAGYNEWAETNKLVVIYPQAAKGTGNPYGCWDWFGYTGANYTTKSGPQIQAIRQLLTDMGVN
jgi:hypothetical protein